MSHSPTPTSTSREVTRYDKGWAALNHMLRSGRSFSGGERNCAYLNLGAGTRFADVSSAAGLDLIDDGRAVAQGDWDGDGDLDLWVANRTAPRVRFLRNDTPGGNHFVQFQLRGTRVNRDGIGARIELYPAGGGAPLLRTLRAGEGYLAQFSKTVHFGLGKVAGVDKVLVRWPGGAPETFTGAVVDRRFRLVEGSGKAEPVPLPGAPARGPGVPTALVPKPLAPPTPSAAARVVLLRPVPLPEMGYLPVDLGGNAPAAGGPVSLTGTGKPLLINLWATWCAPCVAEMREWGEHAAEIRAAGLDVVALCVDEPAENGAVDLAAVRATARRARFTFTIGLPAEGALDGLDVVQRTVIGNQGDLPVPSSFLVDPDGRVTVIYKGRLGVGVLQRDLRLLGEPFEKLIDGAVPFAGQWLTRPLPKNLENVAMTFVTGGFVPQAQDYLRRLIDLHRKSGGADAADPEAAQLHSLLAATHFDAGEFATALDLWKRALQFSPHDRSLHLELARTHQRLNWLQEAATHLEAALSIKRDDPENLAKLARLRRQGRDLDAAIELLREALTHDDDAALHYELGDVLLARGDQADAIAHYRTALRQRPGWPPAANNLAWTLATTYDDALRNPAEAIALAEPACEKTGYKIPLAIGTLAAAYAAAGKYAQAAEAAERAIAVATERGDTQTADLIRPNLELYRAGKAYRQPRPRR